MPLSHPLYFRPAQPAQTTYSTCHLSHPLYFRPAQPAQTTSSTCHLSHPLYFRPAINKVTCDLFPGCIDEVDYEPTKKVRDEANMSKKAVDINDPAASFITVESVTTAFKSFG